MHPAVFLTRRIAKLSLLLPQSSSRFVLKPRRIVNIHGPKPFILRKKKRITLTRQRTPTNCPGLKRFLENNSLGQIRSRKMRVSRRRKGTSVLSTYYRMYRRCCFLRIFAGTSRVRNLVFTEVNARIKFTGKCDFPSLRSINKSQLISFDFNFFFSTSAKGQLLRDFAQFRRG